MKFHTAIYENREKTYQSIHTSPQWGARKWENVWMDFLSWRAGLDEARDCSCIQTACCNLIYVSEQVNEASMWRGLETLQNVVSQVSSHGLLSVVINNGNILYIHFAETNFEDDPVNGSRYIVLIVIMLLRHQYHVDNSLNLALSRWKDVSLRCLSWKKTFQTCLYLAFDSKSIWYHMYE